MAVGGFSSKRLARLRELLERHVDTGFVPGVLTVLARHGEVHITLRDLLTYPLGTGMVPAEPGTIPISDALSTLAAPSPDEWIRRLGTLPLVHQAGERWMYDTAANLTGVLISGPPA